jgi:hypothetical protein
MLVLLQRRKIGSNGISPKGVNLFQSFAWVLAVVEATDIQQQQRRPVVVEVVVGLERLYGQRFSRQCYRVSYGFRCHEVATPPAVERLFRLDKSPLVKACCCYLELRTQELAATGLEQQRALWEQRALLRTY